MVLTPIKRLLHKDKTPFDDDEAFGGFDSIVPKENSKLNEKELVEFTTTHLGDHVIIETDITKTKLQNVEVQWNFGHIYVKGTVTEGTETKPFKSKFKMPKGAKKKGIEGHLVKKEKRFYIKIPLKQRFISKMDSEDPEWADQY